MREDMKTDDRKGAIGSALDRDSVAGVAQGQQLNYTQEGHTPGPAGLKQRLQKEQAYHLRTAERQEKAISFLERHPEFAEYLELRNEGLL